MRSMKHLALAFVALFVLAMPAFAEEPKTTAATASVDSPKAGIALGAGIGAGIAILGAGLGIGLIGFAALSGIARQPEAAGKIQVNMIVLAALVEGAAIIALLVIIFPLVGVVSAK